MNHQGFKDFLIGKQGKNTMTFQDALIDLSNNTATVIDLTGQTLTEEQVEKLCSTLASNVSLRSLCLYEVGLDTNGVFALAKVLTHHQAIQRLTLNENPIGEAGVDAIITLFNNHPTLYKVSASEGTKASKTQRNTLKQLNKTYKCRRPEEDITPVNPPVNLEAEAIVETYYDRAWNGKQLMADPVFYPKYGKIYERERLVAHEQNRDETIPLATSVTLQQQIQQYLETKPHLWHEPETGVYIPRAWKNSVLTAIKAGNGDTLHTYWEKHPGLVTCFYPLKNRQARLHEVFIVQGRSYVEDFIQWLEHYSLYTNDNNVPTFEQLFSTVEKGYHFLHILVENRYCSGYDKEDPRWYSKVLIELPLNGGDIYHGLIHLHSEETTIADTVAIDNLLKQKYFPIARNNSGYTPLMVALSEEKYMLAQQLLPGRALSALDAEEKVKLLNDFALNAKDLLNNTPLHHAVSQESSIERDSFIVALLSWGIDDTLINKEGKTAKDLLEEKEPGHYIALLRMLKINQTLSIQQNKQLQNLSTQVSILEQQLDRLLDKVAVIEEINTHLQSISNERSKQITAVLSDDKIQQKFYLPKKYYLRHLFLATAPEMRSADKELKRALDLELQNELLIACSEGNLHSIENLFKRGALLDKPNQDGKFPLVEAFRSSHVHIINYIDENANELQESWNLVKKEFDKDISTKLEALKKIKGYPKVTEETTYKTLSEFIKNIIMVYPMQEKQIRKLIEDWDKKWLVYNYTTLTYEKMVANHVEKSIHNRELEYQKKMQIASDKSNSNHNRKRVIRECRNKVCLLINQSLDNLLKNFEHYKISMDESSQRRQERSSQRNG